MGIGFLKSYLQTTLPYMYSLPYETLRLGVIGMGGFGLFATQHFLQVPDTQLIAIAGTFREQSQQAARRFKADILETPEELVRREDIDVVYLATPPALHYQQALLCLQHGKHVICEKPLALTPDQGKEMLALAKAKGLLVITNLMQRYNPMIGRIQQIIKRNLLGKPLHGYFENYASDEGLSASHWFWNREISGGIFIEHGVHFFDLFEYWLGAGNVVAAQRVLRPESGLEEQVHATVRYENDVLVNFYHGFTQPGRLDRQELRIVFEHGDITLEEWVPTRLKLRGIVNEEQMQQLLDIFPGAGFDISAVYGGAERRQRGRHQDIEAFQKIELHFGHETDKQHLYGELLRNFFTEQSDYLRGRIEKRRSTEENGLRSLEMAYQASLMAL